MVTREEEEEKVIERRKEEDDCLSDSVKINHSDLLFLVVAYFCSISYNSPTMLNLVAWVLQPIR